MPFGKYSRIDGRRSTSYCSTVTIVVFVALCLVGVWMMTSSTVVPVDMSSTENKSDVKQQVSETDSKPFEDSNGDVPEDAMGGDTNPTTDATTNSDTTSNEPDSESSRVVPEKPDNTAEISHGDTSVKGDKDMKDEPVDTSKTGTYSDVNGKLENEETGKGEVAKEEENVNSGGDETNTGSQEVVQDKREEKISDESTGDIEQEKVPKENSDEIEKSEQNQNVDLSSNETGSDEQKQSDTEKNSEKEEKTGSDEQQQLDTENNPEKEGKADSDTVQDEMGQGRIEEKAEQIQGKEIEQSSDDIKAESLANKQSSNEVFPDGAQSEILNETSTQNGAFSTQAALSKNEKEAQASSKIKGETDGYSWKLCNVSAGPDYIPCLDNVDAIKKLRTTKHYEHRERHCPEVAPTCLVPLPDGYKRPIVWPASRDKVWYHNVPHTKLAAVKGHQNWVKVSGEYLTFPGGGTQFKHGALHYIDIIQEALPEISWGKHCRVVLDVGCGVASFGGYLFDRDTLTMSFAPNDEHEAQVQFALERGIPAISAVMGTKRLPYPSGVFDVIHCARCRVPWDIEGGMLLLELNRMLRPGGYFVWSATPVYQKIPEDVEIWKAMSKLTKNMCWEMVTKTKDTLDHVGLAIYRKPSDNSCYEKREESSPPFCPESDDPNAAWNVPLQACMHRMPVDPSVRLAKWPEQWPKRLEKTPYWLNSSQVGVYGKPAPQDFEADKEHWNYVISKSYLNGMGIDWSKVRNVMDMRAVYGGFAAALQDMKLWVMNIVSIDAPDTLPIIYERGLFGMYHDWCESFSTFPRSYDLLHADHLFSRIKKRCKLLPLIVEVDRILRPGGKLIVRDNAEVINEVGSIAKSLHWEIRMTYSKQNEGLLCVQKTMWRPKEVEASTSPFS